MSIIFYKMPGCYYCDKAEELFKDEIAQGVIVVKPSTEAPPRVSGFPFFVNPNNGTSHTGFPGTKTTLYNKLEVDPTQETYNHRYAQYNSAHQKRQIEPFQYKQNIQNNQYNQYNRTLPQQQHICNKCNLPKY
jgi:hypothetical protein